jgi:hypothetical protein
MPLSLTRFARGFLSGVLFGFLLIAAGLSCWVVAIVVGVEESERPQGISLVAYYVMGFGLAGGLVAMFEAEKVLSVRSVLVWLFAASVAAAGCFYTGVFAMEQTPITWGQSAGGGSALVLMIVLALAITWKSSARRGRRD